MITWVRLWHDMPTDPKFRAIAKASKQPLSAVIAVYTFMLTDASANASERGQTHANDETIGSALDLDDEQVSAIRSAMQGRVLNGSTLAGWDKRQPKREDDSADRSKAWRELKKKEAEIERLRTQLNAGERQEKIREEEKEGEEPNGSSDGQSPSNVSRFESRDALIAQSRSDLLGMGVAKSDVKPLIGKWLADVSDDHAAVLEAINRARDQCPHDPVAWITARLKGHSNEHAPRKSEIMRAFARLDERLESLG